MAQSIKLATSLARHHKIFNKTIVKHSGEVDYIAMAGKYHGLVKVQSHGRE